MRYTATAYSKASPIGVVEGNTLAELRTAARKMAIRSKSTGRVRVINKDLELDLNINIK